MNTKFPRSRCRRRASSSREIKIEAKKSPVSFNFFFGASRNGSRLAGKSERSPKARGSRSAFAQVCESQDISRNRSHASA